ncbi:glycosyltransferase family 4 protein [Rhodovibrionaceae bacterium A322]
MTNSGSVAQRPFRLAIAARHAVPYQVPLYRAAHQDPRLEEMVYLLSREGVDRVSHPAVKTGLSAWDLPLLEGYNHRFVSNWTWDEFKPVISRINPGLLWSLPRGRYDAVLMSGYDCLSSLFTIWACRLSGAKCFLRAEADLGNSGGGFLRRMKEKHLGRYLTSFDAVFYGSLANKHYWQHYGVPEEKLFFLPSSTDLPRFEALLPDKAEKRAAVRQRWQIPDEAVVMTQSAVLQERKRPLDVLQAFLEVEDQQPDAWFLVLGDGPLRAEMEALVAARNSKRVIFAGYLNQQDLADHLLASDFLVLASTYDPTPKVLHEAAALGLPAVVSSGVGTARDFVQDDLSGLVFETGDVAGLSAALGRLFGEAGLRQRLSQGALSQSQVWSPQAGVDGLVAALTYSLSGPTTTASETVTSG